MPCAEGEKIDMDKLVQGDQPAVNSDGLKEIAKRPQADGQIEIIIPGNGVEKPRITAASQADYRSGRQP